MEELHKSMLCLGLNYRSAPVAIRECFSVAKRHLAQANQDLRNLPAVDECVLLSTCNRTEVYLWTHQIELATESILQYFSHNDLVLTKNEEHFYTLQASEALEHLGQVAAGMDSMVLGETEIFGQLKEAYKIAYESKATGHYSNRCFQQIFSLGKKVRSQSNITSGPTSVGAVAVQMAQNILEDLSGAHVLLVGAGDIARSTAQSLKSRGAESIFVANRSYERALDLAGQVGGQVIRFSEWQPWLANIDIVLVSTASPVYVVSPRALEIAMEQRNGRPLFLIDLSVPRNVDPACAELDGIHVFDIDALETLADETRLQRSKELGLCHELIAEWMREHAPSILKPRSAAPTQGT